jgi:SP family sugar:H+ symporter-like MFS transporter
MSDWLETFGKYDSSIGWYLPTNESSLVVRLLLRQPLEWS